MSRNLKATDQKPYQTYNIDVRDAHSKSWDKFRDTQFDVIILFVKS